MARSPCIVAGTPKIMAKHIMHLSTAGRFSFTLLLALVIAFSGVGSAQDGQKGAPPQEPPKGQGPSPKSGGQSGGGVSTGVGVDVGQVIGLFRHHAKAQLQANPQQVRAGDPILFSATVTPNTPGLTYEFHWSKDKDTPGQREITPNVNHAYLAPGQYAASVIVYSNGKKVATSNDVNIVVQQAALGSSGVAQGQPASGPASSAIVWNLSLPPNQVKSGTIVANNKCNQTQRWEVVSQPFPAFMHLTGDWSFDVNAHSKRDLPVQFDSHGLKEGAHEGTVIIRCITCKAPDCNQDRNVVNVHLTVEPALAVSTPGTGANGLPASPAPTQAPEPVKTATVPPTVVPPLPDGNNTTPTPVDRKETLSTAKSGRPQSQNAQGSPARVSTAPQTEPKIGSISVSTENASQAGSTGAASGTPDQPGPPSLSYSVSLRTDSRIETGKPVSFSAELYPDPPSGKPVQYCFSWGDGSLPTCQDSPAATHAYRSRGRYLASVEALVGQEKLASAIQLEAVLPWWLTTLLILAVMLALLAAALGTHKARKVVKAAVTVKTEFGSHKITPEVIESGEGLRIRCVRTEAVSKIIFSPSDPLTQENKETANV